MIEHDCFALRLFFVVTYLFDICLIVVVCFFCRTVPRSIKPLDRFLSHDAGDAFYYERHAKQQSARLKNETSASSHPCGV